MATPPDRSPDPGPPATTGRPGDPGLLIGVAIGALLVLATDGRVLAFSNYPRLYGILNAMSCRFEETLLYLPVVQNFSFLDPLRADFTGPGSVHGLAPFPYVTFALAKLLSLLAGGSVNGTVLALHGTLVINIALTYKVCRLYCERTDLGLLAALSAVFGLGIGFFAVGLWQGYPPTAFPSFWLAASLGACLYGAVAWRIFRLAPERRWLLALVLVVSSALLANSAWPYLLGVPLAAEQIAMRFLSPGIPLCWMFLTIWMLLVTDRKLHRDGSSGPIGLWLVGTALVFVANFYVYFVNWLILSPAFLAWLIVRRHELRREPVRTGLIASIALVASLPFLATLVATKTHPGAREFMIRSGHFGIALVHRFNYPPFFALWGNLALIGLFAWVLMSAAPGRALRKLEFRQILPLMLYTTSVLFAYFNYLKADTIPVPLLLHRYWVPLIALNVAQSWQLGRDHWPWADKLATPHRTFVLTAWLAAILAVLACGQWYLHEQVAGPSMEDLATAAEGISKIATPEDILVSDWQSLNLFAPNLGIHTLSPNPVITLGSNDTLMVSYMALNRLLSRSPEEFWRFLGDMDTFGEAHEQNLNMPATALVLSQVHGVAYPLTPPWLRANRDRLLAEYSALSLDTAIHSYPSLLFCLRDTTLPQEVREIARYVGQFDTVHCSRVITRQSPT